MSEWQNFKLREVGTLQRGRSRHRPRYAFHLFNGPYPFIQTGEVREARKYVSTFENTYSEAGLAQSKLWPKGTLCITIAANIAELAILGFDACFPDSVLGFIPDETRSDLDFVYYTLTHFQKQLKHIGEGSVQDNINLGTFEDIEFPFPSLTEQKAIASVLSSLDDKIDLLHRQNKTLEAMAETLFRQWFIEEAKEDWIKGKVEDLFTLQRGYDLPSSKRIKGEFPLYAASGLNDMINAYQVEYPTVITGRSGSIGGVYISLEKSWPLNTTLFIKEFKLGTLVFSYFYLKYLDLESFNAGSAVPSLNRNHVHGLEIQLPPSQLIKEYEEIAQDWMLKVKANKHQIQTLENLRDTLLPKLMSGEVRVQYQTEEVA